MNPVEEFLVVLNVEESEGEITKEAGFLGNLWQGIKAGLHKDTPMAGISTGKSFGRAFGEQLPYAAGALAVSGMGVGAKKGYTAIKEKFSKPRDYKAMMEANPTLRKEPAKNVQMVYNSLRTMSPSMSKDPLIAGSFVRNTLDLSPETGPAIAPQTVKTLTDAQLNIERGRGGPGVLMDAWTGGGGRLAEGVEGPKQPTFDFTSKGLEGKGFDSETAARDFGSRVPGQVSVNQRAGVGAVGGQRFGRTGKRK